MIQMRTLLYSSIFAFLVWGCQEKNDLAPEERPEERMRAALSELRSQLVEAPHGWKGYLTPHGGGGYGLYMDFYDNDRVSMVADLSPESADEMLESTFRVKAVMAPSLLFDTYSYIHWLADPTPSAYGGRPGRGFESDFEFEHHGSSGDTLFMVGKKLRSGMTMIKATAEEKDAFQSGQLKMSIEGVTSHYNSLRNPFLEVIGTSNRAQLTVDVGGKTVGLTVVDDGGNVLDNIVVPFAFTLTGIKLLRPTVLGNISINGFDFDGQTLAATYDGGTQDVSEFPTPLVSLDKLFGWRQPYTGFAGSVVPGVNSEIHILDDVYALFTASGRTVTDMNFALTSNLQATVTINYVANSSGSAFVASATYNYTIEGDVITLSRSSVNVNWPTRAVQVAPFDNFFGNGDTRSFRIAWAVSDDPTVTYAIGALYPLDNPNRFFYGRLQ